MKLRRLREDDVLDDGSILLVRGGELDPEVLRADARRYHDVYTVGLDDLDNGIARLIGCAHQSVPNPHHDA